MTEPQVRVGVGALIERDGRWLVLRRAGAHGEGLWGLVGGHQEFGESPEETAVRECAEEVGLTAAPVRRVGFTNDFMPDEGKHYITLFVACSADGDPVNREPDKASEMAWFSPDELRGRGDVFLPLRQFLAARSAAASPRGRRPMADAIRARISEGIPSARWRVGRKVGRTIYLQDGPEPFDDDLLIGMLDDPVLVRLACEAVNALWEMRRLQRGTT